MSNIVYQDSHYVGPIETKIQFLEKRMEQLEKQVMTLTKLVVASGAVTIDDIQWAQEKLGKCDEQP